MCTTCTCTCVCVRSPLSPPGLPEPTTGLPLHAAFTSGDFSKLTKCLVRLVLGLAQKSVEACIRLFFDPTLRRSMVLPVMETMTCA